ncbi:CRISPR-associated helicase Cas3' [Actinocrinis puniceicyclus]|uniref:CRISPR-associated helicase Cas3 n=1 Tax=Actinocrinis puniceicyclus TaxID=977794 RepID=A0A8J7WSH8_9ACTN|nr:CRISPR-associated helicase Cas3' [Actinocrinis puniceicyclus]MBS2965652.1 CRISPR-associated helicase Cas3' [Actinocrinis puniceicyclus]
MSAVEDAPLESNVDGVSLAALAAQMGYGDESVAQLGVLWGKSAGRAGGTLNLLLSHMLDTAAVAEQIWHGMLAEKLKVLLNGLGGGDGLRFFTWLCGVHDCGKATPAHQALDEVSAAPVLAAGLRWPYGQKLRDWRHTKAGGKILRDILKDRWAKEQIDWVWPIVAGHHGTFPPVGALNSPESRKDHHGRGAEWRAVQAAVVEVFTRAVGYPSLDAAQPSRAPSRSEQLALSGLVIMADWVASNESYFTGIADLNRVSVAGARERAHSAWVDLGLCGGWGRLPVPGADDVVRERFGDIARPFQRLVLDAARRMAGPGLVIVEAPMGEGKTKAALAAAEVLAARFGADGVFLGMPTQATCDPMYSLMHAWASGFGGGLERQVALLHGKSRFNPEWRKALRRSDADSAAAGASGFSCDDFNYGDDMYGGPGGSCDKPEREAPAEWFLGPKRGLLVPFVVGTVDQLLHAATRTKHVMVRFAGLAGKVVIVDEVHAADVYMEQFLTEALRWLGRARVPVILLSATLAPGQRRALTWAYLCGALGLREFSGDALPEPGGYPSVTAVTASEDAGARFLVEHAQPWRPSLAVRVEVLEDASAEPSQVPGVVREKVGSGGVALVIMNSVKRAQYVYQELMAQFGEDAVLLHGRLCAADRADRTGECVRRLSPGGERPRRMVIVATQVAEQSFDIDADVLITDIAPIDLLLQRIGRIHRHAGIARMTGMETPSVVVTGFEVRAGGPRFDGACEAVYGSYRLLRTAAKVLEARDGEGWQVPADVPQLVADVYGEEWPVGEESWHPAHDASKSAWLTDQGRRAGSAEKFLLGNRNDDGAPTLAGLHRHETSGAVDDEELSAVVRDGDPTVEAILVRRSDRGYCTLHGARIGINGEASENLLDEVLGGTTRLPAKLTTAAKEQLRPLNGWLGHEWLKRWPALVLEEDGTAQLGEYTVGYDRELGLTVERDGGPGQRQSRVG